MSDKQALENLDQVINSGEKEVTKGDRRITFRSVNELEKIENRLNRKVHRNNPHQAVTTNVNRGL
jgi:hypothetical protein